MTSALRTVGAAAAGLTALALLSACTENASAQGARSITVDSGDSTCELSSTQAPSGTLTFAVSNSGSKVTEFYVYDEDGRTIKGEVENIGPGLSRDLVVALPAGTYETACKPGMSGRGIRAELEVTDSGEEVSQGAADSAAVKKAEAAYGDYVRDQTDELLSGTRDFAAAFGEGREDQARTLYPRVRTHWERIETVAESFGDLDPRMDAREADLEQGQEWTGWHRAEKDLWPARAEGYTAMTAAERTGLADQLVADTRTLHQRVQKMSFSFLDIANGSRVLLDEVATGKVTGEEEYWSRTDLYDFQANVDGAHEAFELVQPVVARSEPELEEQVERRFEELQGLLDQHRRGDGFIGYDALTQPQVRALADGVNALSEPLSRLPGAVA